MKVLFAGLKYDYNDKLRGFSFEYENFYKSLKNMKDIDTIFFDISDFGSKRLRDENNMKLLSLIDVEKPEIFFYMPYQDNIYAETLDTIKNREYVKSVCWFSDDHWRFDSFSKNMCWHFDFCVTTDSNSIEKYHKIGYNNIVLSQWACNQHNYKKLNKSYKYDVSFVGQPHGIRREIIEQIKKNDINIKCFGYGWEDNKLKKLWNKIAKRLKLNNMNFSLGRVSQEEMIEIFNISKINLNISNSSELNSRGQIKGRNFEVPGCGGFLLTEEVEYLDRYYNIGNEIITYKDEADLISKIKYYLLNEEEREAIALAGYKRTIEHHKYEDRFAEIFNTVLQR